MAPTTPGGNALEADEGAKQWARLVAKKPTSPKKVTSLARTTSQPRPSDQPTTPKRVTNHAQAANRATANGEHRSRVHWPGRGAIR